MKKVYYYDSFDQDFIESKNQNYELPDNYKWYSKNLFFKIGGFFWHIIFYIWAIIYCKIFLHVKISNRRVLKSYKGAFLYANHTQVLGDILNPVLMTFPIHPYFICSPANLGIPVLGKILPIAGALPIPTSINKLRYLQEAIQYHYKRKKTIIVYPEAHVWPYCTFIREFPVTSFHLAYDLSSPVFCATTTYQKSRFFKRPSINIYLDGPFFFDADLPKKEAIKQMHEIVYNHMLERSKLSNFEYIKYEKKKDD